MRSVPDTAGLFENGVVMLDLRRMMLLCDLAELGTVTAVAERRSITSSAVSQQLRILESEAGVTLFRRSGRTLGLTRAGAVLTEHARRVLGAVDEALSAVAATQDHRSAQVVVAAYNMAISLFAAPLVRRLAASAPGIRTQIRQESRGSALRLLRQGEIDVAITCSYAFGEHESLGGLTHVALLDEPLVLVAPPRLHPAIRAVGVSALAEEAWVTGPEGSGLGVAVARLGERAGFSPRVSHRLLGAQNICDVAGTGVGPAIIPALSVPDHMRALVIDEVEMESRQVSAVVRTGRHRDPNTRVVIDTLTAIAREFRPQLENTSMSAAS